MPTIFSERYRKNQQLCLKRRTEHFVVLCTALFSGWRFGSHFFRENVKKFVTEAVPQNNTELFTSARACVLWQRFFVCGRVQCFLIQRLSMKAGENSTKMQGKGERASRKGRCCKPGRLEPKEPERREKPGEQDAVEDYEKP